MARTKSMTAAIRVASIARGSVQGAFFYALQADIPVAVKLGSIQARQALTVLCLHSIADERRTFTSMTPALFDDFLSWLKQRFRILVFGDLETFEPSDKPALILSFDDGYKDFIDNTAPILEKHGVRVNINVLPSAIESGLPPMNVMMQDFIESAPSALLREVPLPGLPQGADPQNRGASCLRASAALKNRPISEQRAIFSQLQGAFSRFEEFRPTAMMSREEVRQISSAHEVGAHSFEHASMAFESDDYLREDARKCREYFLTNLGYAPQIYAFPNGSARAGQAKIVHGAGYKHVLLVGQDYSRPGAWLHPRFGLYAKSDHEGRARALGWFRRAGAAEAG
jgi:peptidoglycan/xylan/chitin deacetylase (PgdA/CDA1 family)